MAQYHLKNSGYNFFTILLIVTLVFGFTFLSLQSVHAAFPGDNGKIVFSSDRNARAVYVIKKRKD